MGGNIIKIMESDRISRGASMQQAYQDLIKALKRTIDEQRIITDPTLTLAYGTDASFYRLVPKLILQLDTLE